MKRETALGILSLMLINGTSEEIPVMVDNASGRWNVRSLFLSQPGAEKVTNVSDAPKKAFVPDTIKVVLIYAKNAIQKRKLGS